MQTALVTDIQDLTESIPTSWLSILGPENSAQLPLLRERISPMGNAAVTGGSGLAVHRQCRHSQLPSALQLLNILSTHLTSQMDLTDPQQLSTQLEAYPSQGHLYQPHEVEQMSNDIFYVSTTGGGGES